MLHARLVLSHYPHARIVSIDAEAARALPGVVGVYTAHDLPLIPPHGLSRGRDPLARERVLFDGHPVAAVVAESEEVAEDAAGLVTVEYDELEASVDPQAALADKRGLVHAVKEGEEQEEAVTHTSVGGGSEKIPKPANAAEAVRYRRGDVEAGFREADAIVERTYRTPFVHQAYMEPQSCVAVPDAPGHLTVYTSTQGAYFTRTEVAAALGIPQSKVNVVTMELGGGFGAKYALVDPLVAGLAWQTKRPVRLVYTRNEEFLAANPAPATIMHVKTGARRDGTLTALQATLIVDTGTYPSSHGSILCALLGGMYRCPNLLIDGYEVFTHKVGAGAYRAPAAPQACFAMEGQMDELARQLGLDPMEFRLHNVVDEGDPLPDGSPWPRIGARAVLETLRDHPAWQNRRQKGPGEGVGIALAGWPGFAEPASAVCRLNEDGTLTVTVGSADISGTKTGFVLLTAEAFGADIDAVNVVTGDTNTAPYGPASGGSKITFSVGAAVLKAAADARQQVLAIAANHLEVSPDDLDVVGNRVEVRGAPGRGMGLDEVARKSLTAGQNYEPVFGRGNVSPGTAGPGFVAHLARVRVDEETGQVHVLDYVAVQDVGRASNPAGIEDQIHGGVVQGIGWALYESMAHDGDGRLQTGSLMDYTVPSAIKAPPMEAIMVEVPAPTGPLGARGVGEPPIMAGAGAVAAAIADATGARFTELPMTPERVVAALRQR